MININLSQEELDWLIDAMERRVEDLKHKDCPGALRRAEEILEKLLKEV